MKLIRLPSGPLACVFPVEDVSERGKDSGVYRAYSGSLEADGPSEDKAIEALDAEVRRLSVPPPPDVAAFEQARNSDVANDVTRPGLADTSGRFSRYSDQPTIPAPASSSRSR